jgi:hypothetical protein
MVDEEIKIGYEPIGEEVKGKDVKNNPDDLLVEGLVLGFLCGAIIMFALAHHDNAKLDSGYVSNLTNTSLLQGYVVGYNTCEWGFVDVANKSLVNCKSLTFNMSGDLVEFIPRRCLNI